MFFLFFSNSHDLEERLVDHFYYPPEESVAQQMMSHRMSLSFYYYYFLLLRYCRRLGELALMGIYFVMVE